MLVRVIGPSSCSCSLVAGIVIVLAVCQKSVRCSVLCVIGYCSVFLFLLYVIRYCSCACSVFSFFVIVLRYRSCWLFVFVFAVLVFVRIRVLCSCACKC